VLAAYGTLGWMAAAWLVGLWFENPAWLCGLVGLLRPNLPYSEMADIFRLGGVLSFALTAYSLTLPPTPPRPAHDGKLAPLAALQLLRGRAFFVYALCLFGLCVTYPFGTQGTPLLLDRLGVPRAWMPRILTLAQLTEVISLALLPILLLRLGTRGTMLVGLAAFSGAPRSSVIAACAAGARASRSRATTRSRFLRSLWDCIRTGSRQRVGLQQLTAGTCSEGEPSNVDDVSDQTAALEQVRVGDRAGEPARRQVRHRRLRVRSVLLQGKSSGNADALVLTVVQ